jgi:hypothetical protein
MIPRPAWGRRTRAPEWLDEYTGRPDGSSSRPSDMTGTSEVGASSSGAPASRCQPTAGTNCVESTSAFDQRRSLRNDSARRTLCLRNRGCCISLDDGHGRTLRARCTPHARALPSPEALTTGAKGMGPRRRPAKKHRLCHAFDHLLVSAAHDAAATTAHDFQCRQPSPHGTRTLRVSYAQRVSPCRSCRTYQPHCRSAGAGVGLGSAMRPSLLTYGLVLAFVGAGTRLNADSTEARMRVSVQVLRSCRVQSTKESAVVDCGRDRTLAIRRTGDRQPAPTHTIQSAPGQSKVLTINF